MKLLTLSPLAMLGLTLPTLAAESNTGPAAPPAQIVVAGKRPEVITEVDRRVYRTDADLQATSGSAADVLNNIPSVDVDIDGNLSLRGDSTVTVLIDGKPSGQMQGKNRGAALQGMAAADIAQIEVMTAPSAEFKPDGTGGVINIVTKKNRKSGRSSVVSANLGNNGRRSANLSSSYNSDLFSADGAVELRRDYRDRLLDNTASTLVAGERNTSQTHIDEVSERTRIGVKGGVKYHPDARRTLSLSVDLAKRQDQRSLQENASGTSPDDATTRSSRGSEPRTDAGAAFNFEQKLGREGESFSLYWQRSHSVETEDYAGRTVNLEPATAPLATASYFQQRYDVTKWTAAYARPLDGGANLKLGVDLQTDRMGFENAQSNAFGGAPTVLQAGDFNSQFRYRQQVEGLYATLGKKLASVELLGGLRFEQVHINTLQKISGDSSSQRYGKLYPTFNLLYPLADGDVLNAGFSKRVRKPDPEDLNPAINAANPNTLRQGNADLKPQITNAIEAGYRHEADGGSYGLTLFYRKSVNGDTELLTPLGNNFVLITKANLPCLTTKVSGASTRPRISMAAIAGSNSAE
jgi:outer membrane receptor protein involved in Fe transport